MTKANEKGFKINSRTGEPTNIPRKWTNEELAQVKFEHILKQIEERVKVGLDNFFDETLEFANPENGLYDDVLNKAADILRSSKHYE
jgi:hypothetical protein